ncbi:MAG: ABC transporter permease [Acidimicrobiia bacterium]|nr:ABC transporter permease [Acidimicrobiia bacterium]
MNGARQVRLVAAREIRERSRSGGFLASVVLMVLGVAAAIVLPAVLDTGGAKDVGVTGRTPSQLPALVRAQGEAVGTTVRIHSYESRTAGEQAVRDGEVDVLVIDGQRLEWRKRADEQLRAVVSGAIQLVAIRERATAAGISPEDLSALLAPVPITNVELGIVEGRSPDDETAAFVMTLVLFGAIATYGAMVLSGVVEEKSSRTVEVLLARMPARNLLAGKIAGIGLLGLAQIALIGVVALVAKATVAEVDLPAVRAAVIVWAVVWFILGFALYATVFGALGSLASRSEDAQSIAGPVTVVLVVGFLASFAAIGSASTTWARLVSWFPAWAPFAMPNRIAMGAATWWDPVVAVVLTLVAIAGLVILGGRVYSGAILHTGATLKLRDAWQGKTATAHPITETDARRVDTAPRPVAPEQPATSSPRSDRRVQGVLLGIALVVAAAVYLISRDAVIAIAVGAGAFAIGTRTARARSDAIRRHSARQRP